MERGSGSSRRRAGPEWQWWPQGDHENSEAIAVTAVAYSVSETTQCFAGPNHFLAKAQDGNRAALTQLSFGTEQLHSEGFGYVGKPPEP